MQLTVDKNNYILSKRYAKALIELAKSNDMLDVFYNNLTEVLEIYKNSLSLQSTISLPTVDKEEKKEILKNILNNKVNKTVLNFLYVLIDFNRFEMLETIVYCFKEETDKIKNILNAKVVSSTDFNEDMKKRLQEKLERKTNKKINVEYTTDNSLIAGFILTIGEKVVDLSLKNQIIQIKKQLI